MQCRAPSGRCTGACHHDDVYTAERLLMQPEGLPRDPLQAIAIDSASHRLAGDGQAEARVTEAVRAYEYG